MTAVPLLPDFSAFAPHMMFGDGGVSNDAPTTFKSASNVPGALSPWAFQPWSCGASDPAKVSTRYWFPSSDNSGGLYVDQSAPNAPWMYELHGSGGVLTAAGGANRFLTAPIPASPAATMDNLVRYQVCAAVLASAAGDPGSLAQAFTGFTFWFNEPYQKTTDHSLPSFLLYLEIPIVVQSAPLQEYLTGSRGAPRIATIEYGFLLPGDPSIPFAPGHDTRLIYQPLNAYLADAIAQSYPFGETFVTLPDCTHDLSLWGLTSEYVGIETNGKGVSIKLQLHTSDLTIDTAHKVTFAQYGATARPVGKTPVPWAVFAPEGTA